MQGAHRCCDGTPCHVGHDQAALAAQELEAIRNPVHAAFGFHAAFVGHVVPQVTSPHEVVHRCHIVADQLCQRVSEFQKQQQLRCSRVPLQRRKAALAWQHVQLLCKCRNPLREGCARLLHSTRLASSDTGLGIGREVSFVSEHCSLDRPIKQAALWCDFTYRCDRLLCNQGHRPLHFFLQFGHPYLGHDAEKQDRL